MSLAVKNDEANLRKVRQACEAMHASGRLPPSASDGGGAAASDGGVAAAAAAAAVSTGQGSPDDVDLRSLLEAERSSGVHPAVGVLAEPSAALSLVWMLRSLRFQTSFLLGLLEGDRTAPLSKIVRDAYRSHLEPYHNFWLKNTFRAGLGAIPRREEFLQRLAPEVTDRTEREAKCYDEMSALVEVQARGIASIAEVLRSLNLDDTRKA